MAILMKAHTPDMSVQHLGTRQAGRCYTISTFQVRSTYKLQHSVFEGLREAGLLGYGQGYTVSSAVEEQELLVPVKVDDHTGEVVAEGYENVHNPYSREPYKHSYRTVYVYTVTSECDSSD